MKANGICPVCCNLVDACECSEREPRERQRKTEYEEWKRRRDRKKTRRGR